jgi:coproporphyrinogen III oxidase
MNDWQRRTSERFRAAQDSICKAIEVVDGREHFHEDLWDRPGGGGGRTRVLAEGAVFEKGGVNFSAVQGELPEPLAKRMGDGPREFFATGVSLVLHPRNPHVPTTHANFRYFERGETFWFGGGADLTPYYPRLEDARHFHATLKRACDAHDPTHYPRFKKWCDEYFFIKHRNEMRGVGGVFFDNLAGDRERTFAFVSELADAFLPAYLPIVEQRRDVEYGDRERHWQLLRRGRYVEFNLVYDRGTQFGLETNGRTESILMSLPPLVRWEYDYKPEPGSPEAALADFLRPRDWLSESGS